VKKNILIIATLDTKKAEAQYLRSLIEERGNRAIVMDVGILGATSPDANISREEVAHAAAKELHELSSLRRDVAMKTMANGAANLARRLYGEQRFDGVIAVGGNQGTMIATEAMKALPIGVPKVMVSTVASGNVRPYVGHKDITMMFSVADILGGVNVVTKSILSNAAGAVMGMCEVGVKMPSTIAREVFGITSFGGTGGAVSKALQLLKARGYEAIVFHSSGAGGSAMEDLITQRVISAVLDLTPHELLAEIFPEARDAYAPVTLGRLEAAGKMGIPQLVAPGGLDYFVYGPIDTVPLRYRERKIHYHNPNNVNVRASEAELRTVAIVMAQRLTKSKGPAAVMIPLRGWTEHSRQGGPLYDPDADAAFVESLKQHAGNAIPIYELDCHMNDPQFAEKAVEILENLAKLKDIEESN
jgi:uncharacterized protein (UPF0261 family)